MGEEDEFGENKSNLSKLFFVGIMGFIMGASIAGLVLWPEPLDEPIVGGLLDEPVCITTADLNRDDILLGMIYGRHCESIGLISGAYWTEDAEGRKFATPICIEPTEEVQ